MLQRCSNFLLRSLGFICQAQNLQHVPVDDEDRFCSRLYEQNGSYKSIVTATEVGVGGPGVAVYWYTVYL